MSDQSNTTSPPIRDNKMHPHLNPRFSHAYEHAGDRLLERYRLFITPKIWDNWHAAIKSGNGALYVDEANEGEVWRVKVGDVAVFVAIRDDVIRTVFPNTGRYMHSAREAAAPLGETSLGLKLPAQAPVISKKEAKLQRIKLSEQRQITQNELFVRAVRAELGPDKFKHMWDVAKTMFPDDPAWASVRLENQH